MSTSSLTIRSGALQLRDMLLHPIRLLFSAQLWKALAFVALNLPAGLLYFLVLFTLLSVGVGSLPVGIGLALLALVPPLTLIGAWIERGRITWLLGSDLTSHLGEEPLTRKRLLGDTSTSKWRPRAIRAFFRQSWELAHERDTWRSLSYLLLLYPIATIEALIARAQFEVFRASIVQPTLAVAQGASGTEARLFGLPGFPEWGWPVALISILVGIIWLFANIYLLVAAAGMHRALARWLLGPSPHARQAQLEARVQALDLSRTRLVDAALLERRRIERDLHDGAQQRLVALALDLGMAREKLTTQPEEASALIAQAHEEAKRALAELRNLVRGIHPAVLTDRGLDPALSALAARCPVPVTVTVDLRERPPEIVEATAYFVAAEALTNTAKHSGATEAIVEAQRARDTLFLRIFDNGQGGADPAGGTGLTGIADRVAALDGRLTIISPVGGPTSIIVELPWK